jgi:hypothetical protein
MGSEYKVAFCALAATAKAEDNSKKEILKFMGPAKTALLIIT